MPLLICDDTTPLPGFVAVFLCLRRYKQLPLLPPLRIQSYDDFRKEKHYIPVTPGFSLFWKDSPFRANIPRPGGSGFIISPEWSSRKIGRTQWGFFVRGYPGVALPSLKEKVQGQWQNFLCCRYGAAPLSFAKGLEGVLFGSCSGFLRSLFGICRSRPEQKATEIRTKPLRDTL